MVQRLAIRPDDAAHMCLSLYKSHGTTMAGLVSLGYTFDYDEFSEFVCSFLPYHVLRPDPALRSLLLSLPQRKLVFTNADKAHAIKVLSRLNIEDCFERVICLETFNIKGSARIVCKPSLEAFHHAISVAGLDPSKTLFFDDSLHNVEAAKLAGLHAILVGGCVRGIVCIESVHMLKEALPVLWQEEGNDVSGDELMQNAVDETLVVPSEVVSLPTS
ncbi:hypothetical protein KP509_20G039700 [Ceratopteris richardii]|nr:hypothetical protein KP509_20G039700 [Ceratopteris richardii]